MKNIVFILIGLANTAVCAETDFNVTEIGNFSPWAWSSPSEIVGTAYSENGPSSLVVYQHGNLTNLGNITDATLILPRAINASGQIIVNALTTQGTNSYLINGSSWTPIQIPRQSSYDPYQLIGSTHAIGLTSDGTVYGWYDATNNIGSASVGFTYRDGVYRDLHDEIPMQHSRVIGVGSDHSILINAHSAYGLDYSVIRQSHLGSTTFTHPNRNNGEVTAVAMNGDGGFAGNISTTEGGRVFRVDADGTYHEFAAPILPTPTGFEPNTTSMYLNNFPLATRPMNQSGTIAGTIENAVFVFHSAQAPDGTLLSAGGGALMLDGRAFVEQQGKVEILPLPLDLNDPMANLSFNHIQTAGINNLGTVWGTISHTDYFYQVAQSGSVGQPAYFLTVTSDSLSTPFIQINHKGFDIKSLLDEATGVSHFSVDIIDVDDHNNVLIQAWEDVNTISPRAYVLTLVPEPETYTLMLAGLCLVGFAARHKKQHCA